VAESFESGIKTAVPLSTLNVTAPVTVALEELTETVTLAGVPYTTLGPEMELTVGELICSTMVNGENELTVAQKCRQGVHHD